MAYALAAVPGQGHADDPRVWVGGGEQAIALDAAGRNSNIAPARVGEIQLDNHWLRARTA